VKRSNIAIVTLLAGACVASPALGANNRIVLGRSIGALAIGDERATVELRQGPGVVLSSVPNPDFPPNPNWVIQVVRFPSVAVNARFPTAEASITADRLTTRAARYRTSKGIGVGSTKSILVMKHPAAVCSPTICRIGVKAAGRTITRFHVRAGAVWKVEIVVP
jgi:hypothetical protein